MALLAFLMAFVVVASNYLVWQPLTQFGLGDYLTWGAFTYPIAYLLNDLANRWYGLRKARFVIATGFICAVIMTFVMGLVLDIPYATRLAFASGSAFLVAQILDATVFNKMRQSTNWWRAPLISSFIGSAVDTAIFFPGAFYKVGDDFANMVQTYNILGADVQMETWVMWAICDFGVKVAIAVTMLLPYGSVRKMRPEFAG